MIWNIKLKLNLMAYHLEKPYLRVYAKLSMEHGSATPAGF